MKRFLTRTSKQPLILGAASLLFLLPVSGLAQSITTYAGGYVFMDGAQAVTQSFEGMDSVISDGVGGFYFSGSGPNQHRIYRVFHNGTLTGVAGTGSQGFSGDRGPALSAELNSPAGLALDGSGNLLIADSANHRIRKVTPAGTISTVAGGGPVGATGDGGPATSARLNYPSDVTVDPTGALLIADTAGSRIRKVTAAGIISTVAGNGEGGFSGDGGPAILARLSAPSGVTVDASGNILIADHNNNRIRRVTPDGVIQTIAGNGTRGPVVDGGPATETSINLPGGVAVDASGNILIADTHNHRIRKVNASGIISTVAGTGTAGFSGDEGPATSAQLSFPNSVDVDASGNLFIVDNGYAGVYHRIRKVTSAGVISTVAGNGGFGDGGAARMASLGYPTSLGMDSSGNLYIADTVHSRIRKVSSLGVISSVFALSFGTSGIAVDASGNVFFSGCWDPIYKATPDGAVSTFLTSYDGVFCDNYGYYYDGQQQKGAFAVDASGNLLVADTYLNRINRVAPNGAVSRVAGTGSYGFGGDGGPATAALLSYPWGLAFDAAGNLYIADTYNNRIRKITPDGVISTVAGTGVAGSLGDGGPATSAQLSGPGGVAVDAAGSLYIADSFNHRIRKVSPSGIISTVAGTGVAGFGGDGGLATSAQLNFPTGLALDPAGNLFVADSENNRIRRIGFVLTAPTLTSLSTSTSVPGTSIDVTLSGTSFASPLTIDAGAGVTVTNVTVVDDTLATATFTIAADAALGVRNVNLTTSLGTSGSMPFTVVAPYPDLSITSSHIGNFGVGFDATYVVAVSNSGLAATTGSMTVTDPLPAGVTYVSGVGNGWSCSSAQQIVTCVHPDSLPPGGSTTIDLTVAVDENAATGVIHAPSVTTEGDITSSNNTASDATVIAVPVVNARFEPPLFVAGDQVLMDLTLPFAFPQDISGTLTLGFTPDAIHPADDPAIQFDSGGRTVAFTIPANTVQARFGANTQTGPIGFQAGTISGTLSFNGSLQTGVVETALSSLATIPKQAPKIHGVVTEEASGNSFRLGVHLTSSPREVTQLVLRFVGSQARLSCGTVAGCAPSGDSLILDVRPMFDSWFIGDTMHGSASTLHLPFSIDRAIQGSLMISLGNRFGTSNSVTFTLP